MKTLASSTLVIALLAAGSWGYAKPPIDGGSTRVFERNVGQTDGHAAFLSRGADDAVFVTSHGLAFRTKDYAFVLELGRPGAATAVGALSGRAHHLVGPAELWKTDIELFDRVQRPAGDGFEVRHRFDATGRPAFDVLVAAGAKLEVFSIVVRGPKDVRIDRDGRLALDNRVFLTAPRAYQRGASIPCRFVRHAAGDFGFEAGPYDRSAPLLIDPTIEYGTLYGGSASATNDVAVDAAGNIFVFGQALDATFPTTLGAFDTTFQGTDAYVGKIDPTQTGAASLVFSTYVGGTLGDLASAGAVGPLGRPHFFGRVSTDFAPTMNAYDPVPNSGFPGFIAVLSANGAALDYGSFFSDGSQNAIDVDATGTIYVGGGNNSNGHPVTPSAYQSVVRNGDAYVSRLDITLPAAQQLLYSTRFGGLGNDAIIDLAADDNGNAFALLDMRSTDMPLSAGAFQTRSDTYAVARFDTTAIGAASLVYASFLGGTGLEVRRANVGGIATDGTGHAYVTATTLSADFPTTPGAAQTVLPGVATAFVTKVAPTGTALVYSTFVGGAGGSDEGYDIAVNAAGEAFISHRSSIVPSPCGFGSGMAGGQSGMSRINAAGSAITFATLFGQSEAYHIALRSADVAVVAGRLIVPSFPLTGGFSTTINGNHGFVAAVSTNPECADLQTTISVAPNPTTAGNGAVFTINVTNIGTHPANDVVVTDDLPDGVSLVVTSPRSCSQTDPVTCAIGTIAPGATSTVTIRVSTTRTSPVAVVNTAVSTTSTNDADPLNDLGSAVLSIVQPGGPCGMTTHFGTCTRATLTYCEGEGTPAARLVTIDCTNVFPGSTGTCTLIDNTYGNDCAVVVGDTCDFEDDRLRPVYALCDGRAAGCVYDDTVANATCRENVGPCADAPDRAFVPTCTNGVLTLACQVDQPIGYDCAAVGGTCVRNVCGNLPEGARCDGTNLDCDTASTICDVYTDRCLSIGSVCDPTGFATACSGDVLEFCDPRVGRVVRTDCTTAFEGSGRVRCGAPFTCIDDRTGMPCQNNPPSCIGGATGDSCDPIRGIYCGPNLSCVSRLDSNGRPASTCEPLRSTCEPSALTAGCEGDIATFCIGNREGTAREPVGFDCASFGSTCSTNGRRQALCEGGLGAPCDDARVHPNSPLVCGPGLACSGSGRTFGTCIEASAVDGGVGGDGSIGSDGGPTSDGGARVRDAGVAPVKEPKMDEGCGCTSANRSTASTTALSLVLLLGVLLPRVRRRALTGLVLLSMAWSSTADAKGFSGTTLTNRAPSQSAELTLPAGALTYSTCFMSAAQCTDPVFGVSQCGQLEASVMLGSTPGLSPCTTVCQAMIPTLAECEDNEFYKTLCGQLEASTFVIPEPPECKPPNGPAYPCQHPSTCVNLLRQSHDSAGLQFGELAPGLALQTVVVPTTIDENGINTPAPGTLMDVKRPIYIPVDMRSNSLQTTLWGRHLEDVTDASNVDNATAITRLAQVRAAWAANGNAMGSCAEYAYELFYSISEFEDQKVTLGSDHRAIFDLAYETAAPPPAHAIGRRGVQGLPQVRLDGVPSPEQHDFSPTARFKNSFFSANYLQPQQRDIELAGWSPGDPRPVHAKIIIVDDDLFDVVWDGRLNGGYDESWQWHLGQSTGLQPLYLDEQLFQIEKFKANFEQLLYQRAVTFGGIHAILRRLSEEVIASLPEYRDSSFFDPSIYQQQQFVGADPISQILAKQRGQRAARAQAQGLQASNAVVGPQNGFGYGDINGGLPGGQVSMPFSGPPLGGTYSTRGGISPGAAVRRAEQATRTGGGAPALAPDSAAVVGTFGPGLPTNWAQVLQSLLNYIGVLDAQIEDALFEAQALGCLDAGLNACDWSPRMFGQRVSDLGRFREPYFERCTEYTADTGFPTAANTVPFVYPNPAYTPRGNEPMNLTTRVDGQICNRPSYNTDIDTLHLYFDCIDQHKKDLVAALQALLGKEGFVIGPPPAYAVRIGSVEGDTFETGNDMFTATGGFEAVWAMSLPGIQPSNPDWCLLEPSLHAALFASGTALFASFDLVDAQATVSGEPNVDSEAYLEVAGIQLVDLGPYNFSTGMNFNVIEAGDEESDDFFSAQTTIVVVVVPVTIRGGVSGRIGARVGLGMGQPAGESCSDAAVILEGHFTPYVGVDAFASASIDALIVEAGVKVTLTLVQADLPLDVAVEVEGIQSGNVLGANMAVSANLDLVLSILSGWVSAFVEICYIVGCETFEQVLFKWDGPRFTQNLFSLGFSVPLLPLTSFGGGQ